MAENEDRSTEDLSEEISQYRLEEAKNKGQVAQSRELTGLVAFIGAAAVIYLMGPTMVTSIMEFMREVFRTDLTSRMDLTGTHVLSGTLMKALKVLAVIGLPVALAGFVISAITSFSQIGPIFTFEPLSPDLKKIDPIQGFQRLFSLKQAVEALRLSVKVGVVIAISYFLVKGQVLSSSGHLTMEPGQELLIYGATAWRILISLAGALILFAGIDFFLQKREFHKGLRLTKQEAKQEAKERDGDPMIKARIRSIQREMARRRMMQAVKKADVIVTNPTHFAVALVYDKDQMSAPKVVAKGADFLAQRIKKMAVEAGIPLVENVPLARSLYKSVKVGQAVPRSLYQAVAEVLAYVYRLKNQKF
ncbi:MAG: flagellar biosynthesis protein FlhB [Bdellovibrionales bacterium]|nr:flagellar biosynthesis protein FlhB [Bdellovibrionales bacterium]